MAQKGDDLGPTELACRNQGQKGYRMIWVRTKPATSKSGFHKQLHLFFYRWMTRSTEPSSTTGPGPGKPGHGNGIDPRDEQRRAKECKANFHRETAPMEAFWVRFRTSTSLPSQGRDMGGLPITCTLRVAWESGFWDLMVLVFLA